MNDPYAILGLSDDADDDAIRRRYLELVKRFPPEHHPAKKRANNLQISDDPLALR